MPTPVTIKLDPITRIEGHLSVETVVDGGVVKEAHVAGTLFRGFENIIQGHSPLDVIQFAQRFCGVCPTAHAIASAQALDSAFGIVPTENGRVIRGASRIRLTFISKPNSTLANPTAPEIGAAER